MSNSNTLKLPFIAGLSAFWGYGLLIFLGHVRDLLSYITGNWVKAPEGYAPVVDRSTNFYTRRLYRRLADNFNRPIASCPGAWIDVMVRKHKHDVSDCQRKYHAPLTPTGETTKCLNLGSYNYLGFGDPNSPTKPAVFKALEQYGVTTSSSRLSLGTTTLHRELEEQVAKFVGKEDAMVFGMGFGTNSTGIPALIGKGGLIISDANNHSSIVTGARTSPAVVWVFKHNDPKDLERVVRKAIIEGQPKTHRPWKKILIIIEGIYSMEGEMSPLKEIVAIKNKYKCYLYVDEAHSIGAIGKTGRGICEYHHVDPNDVDILMGTFTKSFGAVGGYIASSKVVIDSLRKNCGGSAYSASISPPAAQQVISALKIITGEDGTRIGHDKLESLKRNSNYFRQKLIELGGRVLGDWDSPIVPMLIFEPSKLCCFSRQCLEHNIAVVVVGYPATPLNFSRVRFCISAAHTMKDLDFAVERLKKCMEIAGVRYDASWFS